MVDQSRKPPIGIMPKWRWIELRKEELNLAIKRYNQAGLTVPQDWITELYEHLKAELK